MFWFTQLLASRGRRAVRGRIGSRKWRAVERERHACAEGRAEPAPERVVAGEQSATTRAETKQEPGDVVVDAGAVGQRQAAEAPAQTAQRRRRTPPFPRTLYSLRAGIALRAGDGHAVGELVSRHRLVGDLPVLTARGAIFLGLTACGAIFVVVTAPLC
jgi:hypothetical protein